MQPVIVEKKFSGLGTQIHIQIVTSKEQVKKAEQDLDSMQLLYKEQEQRFSRFDTDSELHFFNSHLGKAYPASSDFIELVFLCLEYYDKTQGWFDPRVIIHLEAAGYASDFKTADFSNTPTGSFSPSHTDLKQELLVLGNAVLFKKRMDFSGIAKGFITDKAARYLQQAGWHNFIVDSGGDIYVAGKNAHGSNWLIGVEGLPEEQLLLAASHQAIATSGISRRKWEMKGKRFHHLINPKEPEDFQFGLRSVTVLSETTSDADVWAKVFYLMGKESGITYANEHACKILFLDYSGNAYVSKASKKHMHYHNV